MAVRRNVQTKSLEVTANGNTSLIAAVAGKTHRILGYSISIGSDCGLVAGGAIAVSILDVAANIAEARAQLPIAASAAATTVGAQTGWVSLGDGFLCAAANTVVNANLSIAITAGAAVVTIAWVDE